MHDAPTGLSRRVQAIAAALATADRPDGELLARWHRHRDEAAFAELVRRHGRLVWGVCRRATPDADDAYQAVFLLLAAKAGRLTDRATVAPWLYRTARRVGQRARRSATRRRTHEAGAAKPEAVHLPEPADWRPAFDAVLAGLPARYRDAVVLCELGGLSRATAAERLGVPVGTLASRLAAARVLLRRRLLRRGVTAGALTVAGVPPAVTAGVASAAANQLARGVTVMGTLKLFGAGVTAVGVLAGVGVGLAARPTAPAAADPPAATGWQAEFRKAYGLGAGQAVRRIPHPFPKAREQFGFAQGLTGQARTDPPPPIGNDTMLVVSWTGDTPSLEMAQQGSSTDPNLRVATDLRQLLVVVCGRRQYEIETAARGRRQQELESLRVPGDFAFDPAAPLADRVAALDRILHDECRLPVRVRLERVSRPVLVASGRFRSQPRPGRDRGHIDVFGHEPPADGDQSERSGDLAAFLTELGDWVGVRIVNAVETPAPVKLRWTLFRRPVHTLSTDDFVWRSDEVDHDWRPVSWTVGQQTGLTFRLDERPVEVVRIEPAK